MSRRITPRTVSTDTFLAKIDLPNAPDSVALIRGILLELTKSETWECIEGLTISVNDAVSMAETILESFSERT